ncbi:MAG: Txe/YoeB family addiction module toxin [Prevotella sp.]|nr:Txe/YoeB family addiction module toxin [Prevotella sp.]
MEIVLSPQAQEDQRYWKQTGNVRIMKRITSLLADIQQHPFRGIGKPEPLKGELHGLWSRRITDEHRLVYTIANGKIYVYVISMRFHYSK